MNLICIKCPRGCNLNVEGDSVTGNLCPRGVEYAKEEMTCPMRIVTSLVRCKNKIVPVKTTCEVPKSKINDVLEEIARLKLNDTQIGQIVVENVASTNAHIVVTGEPYLND